MPYDASNAPAYVKKMPKKKRDQWIAVWNSAFASCMKDKGDQKACETSAFKQANGVVKKNVIDEFFLNMQVGLNNLLELLEPEQQSLSMPNLYAQVSKALHADPDAPWEWIIDVYIENASLFVITTMEGKLFKRELTISNDTVTVGDSVEVSEVFQPKSQGILLKQQADGSYRWFLVTGSTVLNRNGYMNSKEFFDSMFERCQKTGNYPTLDVYHLGIVNEKLDIGIADWLARDENLALASGTFYDTPFAKAAQQTLLKDSSIWGSSNAYFPLKRETVEVAPDVFIKVDVDGEYDSIALLLEKDACSLFTSAEMVKEMSMDKRIKDGLVALLGQDLADEAEKTVDGANKQIIDENLVHQNVQEPAPVTEPPAVPVVEPVVEPPAPVTPVPDPEPVQLEMTDELVDVLAKKVALPPFVKPEELKETNDSIASLTASYEKLQKAFDAQALLLASVQEQLKELQKPEEQKKKDFIADMPRTQRVQIGYRPKEAHQADAAKTTSLADKAAATLEALGEK